MAEYLGVDYGTKRIGLSYANDDLRLAVPLDALICGDDAVKIANILEIIRIKKIDILVIGQPWSMDGGENNGTKNVAEFVKKIKKMSGVGIVMQDERLSSFISERAGEDENCRICKSKKGTMKVRRRGDIDSQSACVILQDFLDENFSG